VIEMAQIKLLQLKESHIEKIRIWRMSKEVSSYMYTDPVINLEEQKKWFEKVRFDKFKKFWVVNVDGLDVGLVSLYDIDWVNERCFWAYYLADPSVRGKGVGGAIELNILRYVFEQMKLNKLCCEVLSSNEKVLEIHKKFGSKVEGLFREHICKNSVFLDVVRLGILKSEWLNEVKGKFVIPEIEIEQGL
jgi:UDP-4-amino-4,6-dideoxy-N-acetyl-beta-L-altrosamine N-acetyltransferase